MAINKAMQLALKALSYSSDELDLKSVYKLQRSFQNMKVPKLIKPPYKMWDHKVFAGEREILTRIYEPDEQTRKELILFFHGGGWVTENIDTYNKVCANLTKYTGCRVASVEYRLAPENPFPDGLDDCYTVTREILMYPKLLGTTAEDVVLMGDSAGGNFAAVISMLMRDMEEFRISRQILLYPATNNDYTETSPFKSVHENGTDYLLTAKHMTEYLDLYIPDEADRNNPYAAPLLATDFTNLPKTLVITAEFDPLRDEGELYAKKLHDAGNVVKMHRMKNALHGFISLDPHYEHVRKTYKLINRFLDEV